MILKQILEVYDYIDSAYVTGADIKKYLETYNVKNVKVTELVGNNGSTDFVRVTIEGTSGKLKGGTSPTLGILGRLGGIGARPEMIGMVSDGDGALVALAIAAKLLDMQNKGDFLKGDIVISTHICPKAPTQPHKPVPFMGSPVDMSQVNEQEVSGDIDAFISIDTTKGNRIINVNGFAISPTIKEGYILKVSEDILDIMQITTGKLPYVFPVSTQDITPYGNNLYHLNSILQPATATDKPVLGVAITTEVPVPGCATGATHPFDLEEAGRFVLEVAKSYTNGDISFYDESEYLEIVRRYGMMTRFQTLGE